MEYLIARFQQLFHRAQRERCWDELGPRVWDAVLRWPQGDTALLAHTAEHLYMEEIGRITAAMLCVPEDHATQAAYVNVLGKASDAIYEMEAFFRERERNAAPIAGPESFRPPGATVCRDESMSLSMSEAA